MDNSLLNIGLVICVCAQHSREPQCEAMRRRAQETVAQQHGRSVGRPSPFSDHPGASYTLPCPRLQPSRWRSPAPLPLCPLPYRLRLLPSPRLWLRPPQPSFRCPPRQSRRASGWQASWRRLARWYATQADAIVVPADRAAPVEEQGRQQRTRRRAEERSTWRCLWRERMLPLPTHL